VTRIDWPTVGHVKTDSQALSFLISVMAISPNFDDVDPSNHSPSNDATELTTTELLQQIKELWRENKRIRLRAEETQVRANEATAQQVAEDVRRRMEDTLVRARPSHGELLRCLQVRDDRVRGRRITEVADEEGHPFSTVVMAEQVPHQFIIPKLSPYTCTLDLEAHLKAFNTQMLISGKNNAVRCKVFVGTLIGGALKWFGGIPKSTITSFPVFAGYSWKDLSLTGQNLHGL